MRVELLLTTDMVADRGKIEKVVVASVGLYPDIDARKAKNTDARKVKNLVHILFVLLEITRYIRRSQGRWAFIHLTTDSTVVWVYSLFCREAKHG